MLARTVVRQAFGEARLPHAIMAGANRIVNVAAHDKAIPVSEAHD